MTNHAKPRSPGVTTPFQRRMDEHRQHLGAGVTSTSYMTCFLSCEETSDGNAALAREKQSKGWVRAKKVALVESGNPDWRDLSDEW